MIKFFFFSPPLLQNSHYQTKPKSLFLSEAGQDFNVFLDYCCAQYIHVLTLKIQKLWLKHCFYCLIFQTFQSEIWNLLAFLIHSLVKLLSCDTSLPIFFFFFFLTRILGCKEQKLTVENLYRKYKLLSSLQTPTECWRNMFINTSKN